MDKKRDYIQEIVAKRGRLSSKGTRLSHFAARTYPIDKGARFLANKTTQAEDFRGEYLKYLPIGYIAAFESYLRLAIRDLIDFGPPFSENARGFQDFKFQIETVLAITAKRTSVGEFIAHLLPIRNLRDISSAMSVLIGEDFLKRLRITKLSVIQGSEQETLERLYDPNIFAAVEDVFLLRHMFCHEFATTETIGEKRLWHSTRGVFMFVLATESLLNELNVISTMRE